MFSFCILDKRDNSYFVARDRYGIKPLYWMYHKTGYVFSSEIKPLLLISSQTFPNSSAISQYLRLRGVEAPNTIYQGIHEFQPGCYFTNSSFYRYWHFKLTKSVDFDLSIFLNCFLKLLLILPSQTSVLRPF